MKLIWKDPVLKCLLEDDYKWDWTSVGLHANKKANASIFSKSNGIWVCDDLLLIAEELSTEMGYPFKMSRKVKNGDSIKIGQKIATLQGSAKGILTLERPVLNLAGFACGVATQTKSIVKKIHSKKLKKYPRLTPTRKTPPGLRQLALESVILAGAVPHRISLSSGVLIKENHLVAYGSIKNAIRTIKSKCPHGLKIEIEVKNFKELEEAIREKADFVMLDNFAPKDVYRAVEMIKQKATHEIGVEVSGGITLENVLDYTQEGVDVISIGALTHTVKNHDFSLLFKNQKK